MNRIIRKYNRTDLPGKVLLLLLLAMVSLGNSCRSNASKPEVADKPLFRDPVHDGAADPVIVWNAGLNKHIMYYTNRRANIVDEAGVRWVHGTRIGMAVSENGGATWTYLDTCNIRYRPDQEPTYWAPEVLEHEGTYHMYLTYVPGIFADWSHPRYIIHLTSRDGIDWDFQSKLSLDNEKILDATVHPLPEGGWRLWYNNEMDKKSMYYADSDDLYHWKMKGKARDIHRGEGAKVVAWKGYYWMFTDEWKGLGVYRSTDLENWSKQENILADPGTGPDDQVKGQHCDVVVDGERAFVFYFTHPGRNEDPGNADAYQLQRSSIQVAELSYNGGIISCDRNLPVLIRLGRHNRVGQLKE